MKNTSLTTRFLFLCIIIITSIFFLSACQDNNTESPLLSKSELKNCDLLIHNVTTDKFEVRTVPDTTFRDEVISLCTKVESFRPIISADIILGEHVEADNYFAHFILESETEKYTFSFFDANKQLSLDYIHRDSPMIAVSKDEIDENGSPHPVWSWYCKMSPTDYSSLYEMIQTYTAGEIR